MNQGFFVLHSRAPHLCMCATEHSDKLFTQDHGSVVSRTQDIKAKPAGISQLQSSWNKVLHKLGKKVDRKKKKDALTKEKQNVKSHKVTDPVNSIIKCFNDKHCKKKDILASEIFVLAKPMDSLQQTKYNIIKLKCY